MNLVMDRIFYESETKQLKDQLITIIRLFDYNAYETVTDFPKHLEIDIFSDSKSIHIAKNGSDEIEVYLYEESEKANHTNLKKRYDIENLDDKIKVLKDIIEFL